MKIAVVGSRNFSNYQILKDTLDKYKNKCKLIISGGAKGADKLAEKYAEENGIETKIFKPDWKRYGKGAGLIRNKQIVENADLIIAFWDGKSKGTAHTITYAQKSGKQVEIILFESKE